jgi:hypothetical protein
LRLNTAQIYILDRTDLFIICDLFLGGEVIVRDLYSGLEGVIDRERRPVRSEEIVLVMTREQPYVSEPVETKVFEILTAEPVTK